MYTLYWFDMFTWTAHITSIGYVRSFIRISEGPYPENALTGTIFTVNAWRNDPLIVPYEYRCEVCVWGVCVRCVCEVRMCEVRMCEVCVREMYWFVTTEKIICYLTF